MLTINNLYAMNIHYRYYSLEYFFKEANKNGFKNAEIWLCPQHFYINYSDSEDPEKLLNLSKRYGIKIQCLCPEQNNPKPNNIAARDNLIIKNTLNYFKKVIDVADYIDCRKILVTPGWNYYDEDLSEARKRSVLMLQNICDYAKLKKVDMVLESIWSQSSQIASNLSEIKELKDSVNRQNLKLTVDLGAFAAANEKIKDWFETFGKDIRHCHFVDGNPTGHLPWGKGTRDMLDDLKVFNDYNYDGGLSLEFVNPISFRNPEVEDRNTLEIYQANLKKIKEREED